MLSDFRPGVGCSLLELVRFAFHFSLLCFTHAAHARSARALAACHELRLPRVPVVLFVEGSLLPEHFQGGEKVATSGQPVLFLVRKATRRKRNRGGSAASGSQRHRQPGAANGSERQRQRRDRAPRAVPAADAASAPGEGPGAPGGPGVLANVAGSCGRRPSNGSSYRGFLDSDAHCA